MAIAEYGFVRIGTAVPVVRAADAPGNVASMVRLAEQAVAEGCDIVLFPELCISGYTCADLFALDALLEASLEGLRHFLEATRGLNAVFVAGLPLRCRSRLYNASVVLSGGKIHGAVPKTYLPNYHEYYEARWFASELSRDTDTITFCGETVPFGADLIFQDADDPDLAFGIEICEDLWAPIPPSCRLAMGGATILLNPSASNDLVGKFEYRHDLVRQQSGRCLAAYAYCSAGVGESTTDMVFGGDCMIAENGIMLGVGERFRRDEHLLVADTDIKFLVHERSSNTTFGMAAGHAAGRSPFSCRTVTLTCGSRQAEAPLHRHVDPRPFTPANIEKRHDRCQEIFAIQSTGLATRLQHTGIRHVVLGLSGGLDSTLALLVCIDAFARLGLSPDGIHAVTMPGFGTTSRTKGNVDALCEALHINLETVDITAGCRQHLADLGHDGHKPDITFENAQARERTQILMDKANLLGALVIGTGDLSELALGWCTYNGDHMSMYAVNTGVPKTLVSYLIDYYAEDKAESTTAVILRDILATPISPELLPPDENGDIAQKTESVVGPYELHDFFLYHGIRCGEPPPKILFLARQAFGDLYPESELRRWLNVFFSRFFTQQFKRSCLPDGPKVGTIALSPRGDWRMPSDASPGPWLQHIG